MKQPGQIVTFLFPHTDLASGKVRPSLLVAKTPGPFDDWLLCMASTELKHAIKDFDELLLPNDRDFVQSGLRRPTVLRLARLSVVSGSLLIGTIGTVAPDRLCRVRRKLADWLSPKQEQAPG